MEKLEDWKNLQVKTNIEFKCDVQVVTEYDYFHYLYYALYDYQIAKNIKDATNIGVKQHYPPGTQNNYVVFLKLFVVTETDKELNFPKGGKGL